MSDNEMANENEVAREAARREVMGNFLALRTRRLRLREAGMEPTSVVIPDRMNVPYDGDDATDYKGSCMGLPITWSADERWGFVVEVTGLDALGPLATIGERA